MLSGIPSTTQRWDRTDGTGATGSLIRDYQALMFNQRLGRAERDHHAEQASRIEKREHLRAVLRYQTIIHQLKNES